MGHPRNPTAYYLASTLLAYRRLRPKSVHTCSCRCEHKGFAVSTQLLRLHLPVKCEQRILNQRSPERYRCRNTALTALTAAAQACGVPLFFFPRFHIQSLQKGSGRRDAQQHRRRPCATTAFRAPPPRCNCRAAAMGLATAALLALLLFETSRVSASPERVLRQARHTRRRMGGSELRPFETPTDDSRLSAADITLLINSGALPSLSPPPPPSSLSPPSSRPPPTATALSASQAALVVAHGNADAQSRVNSADD